MIIKKKTHTHYQANHIFVLFSFAFFFVTTTRIDIHREYTAQPGGKDAGVPTIRDTTEVRSKGTHGTTLPTSSFCPPRKWPVRTCGCTSPPVVREIHIRPLQIGGLNQFPTVSQKMMLFIFIYAVYTLFIQWSHSLALAERIKPPFRIATTIPAKCEGIPVLFFGSRNTEPRPVVEGPINAGGLVRTEPYRGLFNVEIYGVYNMVLSFGVIASCFAFIRVRKPLIFSPHHRAKPRVVETEQNGRRKEGSDHKN